MLRLCWARRHAADRKSFDPLLADEVIAPAIIAPLGLRLIEIDGAITDATVAAVHELLANPRRIRDNARRNYDIGQKHLSYRVLRRRLRKLLSESTGGAAS